MKESEDRMSLGEKLGLGAEVIGLYGEVLKARIEQEIQVKRNRFRAGQDVKRVRQAGIDFGVTDTQRGVIDATDEYSSIYKDVDPTDIDSLRNFIERLDPDAYADTESASVLARRLELTLEKEELTLEELRKLERKVRSYSGELLRKLIR